MKTLSFQQSSASNRRSYTYTSVKADGRLLDDVCALRYESYIADDYIEPNDTKRFFDKYDHQANCQSFLTYCNGEVLGTIRACVYEPGSKQIIPAMEIYAPEIEAEVGLDQAFVESNKFVISPAFQRRGGTRARLGLMKNIINTALSHDAKTIVTAVRAEHLRFYKYFSFVPISDPKHYQHLKFEAALVACYDIPALNEFVISKIA